ncbi:MAG: hypothetical protein JW744_02830, partial [Candidatus Diapherotrites archaeon]|nr:hypothetical protein [Candidatus Diapherotrites archaeon]
MHFAKILAIAFLAMLLLGAASAQSCTALSDNLIRNSNLETGSDGTPDKWQTNIGWGALGDCQNYNITWENDPTNSGHGKVLAIQYTGNTIGNYCGWLQMIETTAEAGAWYEFSASITTEGIEPIIGPDGNIVEASTQIGTILSFYEGGTYLGHSASGIGDFAHELADWNAEAWAYKTYTTKGLQSWRTIKKYVKALPGSTKMQVLTHTYTKGKVYLDNFSLKKVSCNPEEASFKKSGTLDFIQFKGANFFPIIMGKRPKQNGTEISLQTVKDNGFNTLDPGYYGNREEISRLDLAVLVELVDIYYGSYKETWRNNFSWYKGASTNRKYIDAWAEFDNLLGFHTDDEVDGHSAKEGSFMPELRPQTEVKNYIMEAERRTSKDIKMLQNFNGSRYSTLDPYTGSYQDLKDYYYPLADMITHTANLPMAYPPSEYPSPEYPERVLDKVGIWARNTVEYGKTKGKYYLAYGLGAYNWAAWDRQASSGRYIPFNLQRFLVWDQIINGASGAVFYYTDKIELTDSYYSRHWKQITAITKELSELYDVLLEPQFYGEWQVSDPRIGIMMKKHNGKIYLLTASTHYENLSNVTITLDSKYNIAKITALNEITNGDVDNPTDRSITPASAHSFADSFVGDAANSSLGLPATPGYAVHIYEIELSACGNRACEAGETYLSCPSDCPNTELCGNSTIDEGENCSTCPQDVQCGTG